jgi:hypothetical protein
MRSVQWQISIIDGSLEITATNTVDRYRPLVRLLLLEKYFFLLKVREKE